MIAVQIKKKKKKSWDYLQHTYFDCMFCAYIHTYVTQLVWNVHLNSFYL